MNCGEVVVVELDLCVHRFGDGFEGLCVKTFGWMND